MENIINRLSELTCELLEYSERINYLLNRNKYLEDYIETLKKENSKLKERLLIHDLNNLKI